MAAANFAEKEIKVAAKMDIDPLDAVKLKKRQKAIKTSIVVEKQLNEDNTLKARIENFNQMDISIRSRFNDRLSMLFCMGMQLDEHTEEGQKRIIEDYEN